MAQAAVKITLDTGCEIALDMLTPSPTNVRRTNAETGIEELAEDIARRYLDSLHRLVC